MLINSDFNVINTVTLKKLCKMRGIKGYTGRKKDWMFEQLNTNMASSKIQRMWRRGFYKEAVDSITFDDVHHPCFIYNLPNKIYFYHLTL